MLSIPKYTFLLPAYKGRFLDEMLRSIQSQTYTDFKVIISDDCSPEDLYSICKPYLDDPRFTYRRNEKNMGGEDLVAHWNLLVGLCDTGWLIMSSDDDCYQPTFLEEIDSLRNKYPDVDFIRSKACRIDEQGEPFTYEGEYKEKVTQIEFAANMHVSMFTMCMANAVFRTNKLREIGGFVDFPLALYSDTATMLLMAENGCINTKTELFMFRISDYNISHQEHQSPERARRKVIASLSFDRWMDEWLQRQKTDNSYQQFLKKFTLEQCKGRTATILWDDFRWCRFRDVVRLYPEICGAGFGSRYRIVKLLIKR